MNGYLLDTNVLSELRKGERADAKVTSWFSVSDGDAMFVSVLALGKIRKGIESLRKRDARQALALERWLYSLVAGFGDRVLPVTHEIADRWGILCATRTLPLVDGLLAATAQVNDYILVTRNTLDFDGTGTKLFNPFL